MEASRRAHRLRDATDVQLVHRIGEGAWQLCRLTPAQLTTFQGGLASRTARSEGVEVCALVELVIDISSRFGCLLDLGLAGAFGQRQHDHRQAKIGRGLVLANFRAQKVANFLIAHLDGVAHPTLTYPVDDHLAANLLARLIVADAIALKRRAELIQCDIVAGGDLLHGLVEGSIVDANAGTLAHLQLDTFEHQTVHDLGLQLIFWWQFSAILT